MKQDHQVQKTTLCAPRPHRQAQAVGVRNILAAMLRLPGVTELTDIAGVHCQNTGSTTKMVQLVVYST